jgi:hypothetical protein
MNYAKQIGALLCLSMAGLPAAADMITVANNTANPLYVALYEYDHTTARRVGKPQLVGGRASVKCDRPEKRISFDQLLFFSSQEKQLSATLSKTDAPKIAHIAVEQQQGGSFYITQDTAGMFRGYNSVENTLFLRQADVDTAIRTEKQVLFNKNNKGAVRPGGVASVRQGLGLSDGEKQYLRKRQRNVKFSMKKFLLDFDIGTNPPPKIALIAGGGGAASIFAMLGTLSGMISTGLIDITTYVATASGATWPLGAWMTTHRSFSEFKSGFIKNMQRLFIDILPSESSLMASALALKVGANQPVSGVDLLGVALANRLFAEINNKRQMMSLSAQQNRLKDGLSIFPLYMAAHASLQGLSEPVYFEFNPYEVGSIELNAYIAAALYNYPFKSGRTTAGAPEENFATILATCGSGVVSSAFIAPFWKMISLRCATLVRSTIDTQVIPRISSTSMLQAYASNFTADMKGSRFAQENVYTLQDAGILPYELVSALRPERNADIYIVIDSSGDFAGSLLQNMEEHAKTHNLLFPPIEYASIGEGTAVIFKDEDNLKVPVIVYISAPFVVLRQDLDSGLAYRTREDKVVNAQLQDLLKKNTAAGMVDDFEKQLTDSIPIIKDAILWTITNKKCVNWVQ